MKKLILMVMLFAMITACSGGGGGGGDGGSSSQQTASDFLIRQVSFGESNNKFFVINNEGVEIKELASEITNKTDFTAINEQIGYISTKNGLYQSTDGWNTFNKILTIPEETNYDVDRLDLNTNLKNVLYYQVSYQRKTTAAGDLPDSIYKYYRIDIASSSAREIAPAITNKSDFTVIDEQVCYLSTTNSLYKSTDGWNTFNKIFDIPEKENYDIYYSHADNNNIKNVLLFEVWYGIKAPNTENLPDLIYGYYRIDMGSSNVREIAPEITNKVEFMPIDEQIGYISTKDGLYQSTDGWNTFNKILTIPEETNYDVDRLDLNTNLKNVLYYQVSYGIKASYTGDLPSTFYKYYRVDVESSNVREIAPEITNKVEFMPIDEQIGYISTKDGLYQSTDGWNTFNKILTIPEETNYDVDRTYGFTFNLKNVVFYQVSYKRKTPPPAENLPASLYRYYRVDIANPNVTEIAPEVANKVGFTPIDENIALLSTTDGLYKSIDGWNTFNKTLPIPEVADYEANNSKLDSSDYTENGAFSYELRYKIKTPSASSPSSITEFYESYDKGSSWKLVEYLNASSQSLTRIYFYK